MHRISCATTAVAGARGARKQPDFSLRKIYYRAGYKLPKEAHIKENSPPFSPGWYARSCLYRAESHTCCNLPQVSHPYVPSSLDDALQSATNVSGRGAHRNSEDGKAEMQKKKETAPHYSFLYLPGISPRAEETEREKMATEYHFHAFPLLSRRFHRHTRPPHAGFSNFAPISHSFPALFTLFRRAARLLTLPGVFSRGCVRATPT